MRIGIRTPADGERCRGGAVDSTVVAALEPDARDDDYDEGDDEHNDHGHPAGVLAPPVISVSAGRTTETRSLS